MPQFTISLSFEILSQMMMINVVVFSSTEIMDNFY